MDQIDSMKEDNETGNNINYQNYPDFVVDGQKVIILKFGKGFNFSIFVV